MARVGMISLWSWQKMSEYDHKKSTKLVGQLYPVLLDKAGNTIDGVHRRQADPNWRTERHPEIDTEEKFLVARCVANWHRRQVSREEKEEWINGLAEIYKRQGISTRTPRSTGQRGAINEIVAKLVEVTGLSEKTVRWYLHDKYKATIQKREPPVYRKPASEAIKSAFTGTKKDYGERLVERHREEIKEDLKTDTEFVTEVVKEHPEVVSEAIRTVTQIPEAPVYIPPEEVEKAQKRAKEMKVQKRKLDEDPKVQERRRLFKNLGNLQQIAIYSSEATCPICGADHSNLVWKCHNLNVEEALDKAHEKLEALK